ncbi:hypothetical protein CR492_02115 [Methylocella silvestris]|uniref:Uncharacterized protein n=1 Tax=Methylocella silvestris TaxID=199596 RepID=A0A2J7TLS1_METSI|nr:hypothetical protein CR492_02115 [Methylocella silvestris]
MRQNMPGCADVLFAALASVLAILRARRARRLSGAASALREGSRAVCLALSNPVLELIACDP